MIVDIEKLSVDYAGIKALEDVSFGIAEGDFWELLGQMEQGNLRCLDACLDCTHNMMERSSSYDQDIRDSKRYLSQIGFVLKKPVVDRNFPATIREVVSMSQNSNDSKKVEEALQKVWMHELADRRIGDLSVGQQQRVFIAKALVNSPKILVLDEPVTGIDVYNKDLFFQILGELNTREKFQIIWSSHDLDAVERLANKVACLNKTLFFHGISEEFFSDDEMLKKYSETSMQMHSITTDVK